MDLKIGNQISLYSDNVTSDEKEVNMYFINDLSKYNLEGRLIDRITIIVSKDSKKTIEHFSLFFTDGAKDLYQLSRSTTLNYDKRLESLELAEKLSEQGTDLEYYYDLFKDAFGEPTEKKVGGVKIWTGKKIQIDVY